MNTDGLQAKFEFLRNKEKELAKHKLGCLPEVKQEVAYYLKLSQSKDCPSKSKLEEIFSRLESFPDIQKALVDDDEKNLITLWGKLESIKSIALSEILAMMANFELGLNNWRLDRSSKRSVFDFFKKDFEINHGWAVNIRPPFDPSARIEVLYQPTCNHAVFGMGLSSDNISHSIIHVKLPKDWLDPVKNSLDKLTLFSKKKPLVLDGIDYELFNLSWVGKDNVPLFAMYDIQPMMFKKVEEAFFSVAEIIVSEKGQQAERDYLALWKRYID